jgi:tRNA G10  N-methylase Trm11
VIAAHTAPGDVVLDPMCGIGTTLVEAAWLERRAVGVEYERRWAALAEANLTYAAARGAPGARAASVRCGDSRGLGRLVDPALRGHVRLVLTSPPYGPSTHGQAATRPGQGVRRWDDRYSRDPANLAHQPLRALAAGFGEILAACLPYLAPGGIVAVTTRPWRQRGVLVDLPAIVCDLAPTLGLRLVDRHALLLAAVRDRRLVARASFFQLDHARKATAAGTPTHVIAHEDLLLFEAAP